MKPTAAILLLGSVAALGPASADLEPPIEIGFGGTENVELVEGWPFLVRGDCTALSARELRVLEDGVGVEVVAVDRAERPAYHVLLLDTSASMSDPLDGQSRRRGEQTKAAARSYVQWMLDDASESPPAGRPPELMLVTFDDDLMLRVPATPVRTAADVDALGRAIDAIEGGERTRLYDALSRLVAYLGELPERSVVILLSDGEDTGSRRSAPEAVQLVAEANQLTLFTIGIALQHDHHEEFLRQVAAASGGRYVGVPDRRPERLGAALAERFAQIRDRLDDEFYASWTPRPAPADGRGPARVEIRLESALGGCRVEPGSYRPRRYVRPVRPREGDGGSSASQTPLRLAADRVAIPLHDVIHDDHMLRPGGEIYAQRVVQLVVPDFAERARDTGHAREAPAQLLADTIRRWILAGDLPPQPERGDPGRRAPPWVHEIGGATFLDERQRLARTVYDEFEPYRAWARERIARELRAECERKLAHSQPSRQEPAVRAAEIEAVVAERLDALRPEEIAQALAVWHRDLPARELAFEIERQQAALLLAGATGAPEEAVALERAWPRLHAWLGAPGRVRITTPLVVGYDPQREVFGLTRVVLPRERAGPVTSMPVRPYAIQLVRWLFAHAPLAEALGGYTIDSLAYAIEPVPPRNPPVAERSGPLERHRHTWLLRPAAGGEPEPLELVTETVAPERMEPSCVVVAGAPAPLARAILAGGVPACPLAPALGSTPATGGSRAGSKPATAAPW